jgi:tetratricopeptide (TPR) repeat protein
LLKGENDRAIANFNDAILLSPNYARAFVRRGQAYYNKGDYDRAIADLNEGIRLDPNYSVAFFGRGLT